MQVEGGPNPPEEDLSPVKGNITFLPGRATVVYNLTVLDDEVGQCSMLKWDRDSITDMLENIMSSIKCVQYLKLFKKSPM